MGQARDVAIIVSNPDSMQRWTVFFAGRVQGVGFRYTAQRIAGSYAVKGYVRNLADGRVELVCEGIEHQLSEFVARIQEVMTENIGSVDVHKSSFTDEFEEFDVRF